MFERYTEQARRALFFARYEATKLGGAAIETEHVLLGVLRAPGPVCGRMFVGADISYEGARRHIAQLTKPGPQIPTSVDMPFTDATKRVLHYAAEEADGLAHRHIGSEHLLLGLLRERGTMAERALTQKGISAESVHKRIRDEPASSADESAPAPSRVEALMALERVSSLVGQISQASDPRVQALVQSIELELDRVRRALKVT